MPHGYGPIVVGVDFSEGAARALRTASRLALTLDARLLPVHVAASAAWELSGDDLRWLREVEVPLEAVTLRFGSPWAQIVRYAREEDASLVCVGSHGQSGYQPLTPGSTAARLLTHSPVPVLVGMASRPGAAAVRPGAAAALHAAGSSES
jgi:nucleotide-binding universal stress UspA family protein